PFESYMKRLTSNQSLIDVITQHFFKGTPTFFALSYFALFNDYIYPKGGVGNLTKRIAQKIQEFGGKAILNTEIVNVDIGSKTLTDTKGSEYIYEKLIWAADLKQFYKIATNIPEQFESKFFKEKEKILKAKGAESVFSLFLALDIPPEHFTKHITGHIFYTPMKDGLGELHRSELKHILENWSNLSKDEIYSWLEKYCMYNTFEISIPVLREKDAAPDGKTGMIVSMLFDYEFTKKVYDNGWYDEFKETFSNYIIDTLSKGLFKGIKENIIFKFSATPMTIYNTVKSSEGAIVGWSFENEIPVNVSMLNMKNAVKTSIPNVFKAGQWSFSPAGGPTAIMTGRMAAYECLRR
ncbi:MAG: NAD(P)/FAD-dependent oxidoreductase, partial [Fervidobacterium sp.]